LGEGSRVIGFREFGPWISCYVSQLAAKIGVSWEPHCLDVGTAANTGRLEVMAAIFPITSNLPVLAAVPTSKQCGSQLTPILAANWLT
jgi:hypothetical protein